LVQKQMRTTANLLGDPLNTTSPNDGGQTLMAERHRQYEHTARTGALTQSTPSARWRRASHKPMETTDLPAMRTEGASHDARRLRRGTTTPMANYRCTDCSCARCFYQTTSSCAPHPPCPVVEARTADPAGMNHDSTHTNLSALVNGGHDRSDRDGSVGVVVAEASEEDGVAERGSTPFMPREKRSQQATEVVAPARDFC
jgi:hypothetical protein